MINEQGEGMITKHEVDQQAAAAEIVEKQVEGSKNERRIEEKKRITETDTLKQKKRRL